jgi:glutamate-1-semialdehyde 2,1-aminomutase
MDQHELLRLAERYLPGACLGMMPLPPELRMVLVRGEGSRVYDAAGREYLDHMLGSGPLLLGHAHPVVVAAVQRQAALG